MDDNTKLIDTLVKKSIEAFLLGLEIYNKPTIKYRIEGFSFFMINAWELMLKAELIKRGQDIYFKDDSERTISVSSTIAKIYSDKNTKIRLNLVMYSFCLMPIENLSESYSLLRISISFPFFISFSAIYG